MIAFNINNCIFNINSCKCIFCIVFDKDTLVITIFSHISVLLQLTKSPRTVCVTERYSVVFSDLEVGRRCPSTFPLELVCDCVLAEVLMLSWFVLYRGHRL